MLQVMKLLFIVVVHSLQLTDYQAKLNYSSCIEYDAIKGALRYFNFGEEFIQWSNLLLNELYSCTSNNGFLSDWFKVSCSCHQGCPLAPSLYLVCGAVLAHKIKESQGIKGMTLNVLNIVLAQFADNTQLFLDSKDSLENAITVLATIEKNTGLKVNYEKSCIYSIGEAEPFECSKPLV